MVSVAVASTVSPQRGAAPIDLVHLSRRTLGDRDLEREDLSLFVRQCELYLERLHRAKDIAARTTAAHALAGSAQAVGAFGVAREAFAIEGSVDAVFDCGSLDRAVMKASDYVGRLLSKAS